jgi:hypothetical protein
MIKQNAAQEATKTIRTHCTKLIQCKKEESKAIPVNRPGRPRELWDVEVSTLSR